MNSFFLCILFLLTLSLLSSLFLSLFLVENFQSGSKLFGGQNLIFIYCKLACVLHTFFWSLCLVNVMLEAVRDFGRISQEA